MNAIDQRYFEMRFRSSKKKVNRMMHYRIKQIIWKNLILKKRRIKECQVLRITSLEVQVTLIFNMTIQHFTILQSPFFPHSRSLFSFSSFSAAFQKSRIYKKESINLIWHYLSNFKTNKQVSHQTNLTGHSSY